MLFYVPGPCTLTYGPIDTMLELGISKAGVTIRGEMNWIPVTDDARGNAPCDFIFGGWTLTVDCVLTQPGKVLLATPWLIDNEIGSGLLKGATIGKLIDQSTDCSLNIQEKGDAAYDWSALCCQMIEPQELVLRATQELQIPISIMIVPDANGKLFSTVPTYLTA